MSADQTAGTRRPSDEGEASRRQENAPDEGYPNPQGDDALDEEDAAQEAQETPGMG